MNLSTDLDELDEWADRAKHDPMSTLAALAGSVTPEHLVLAVPALRDSVVWTVQEALHHAPGSIPEHRREEFANHLRQLTKVLSEPSTKYEKAPGPVSVASRWSRTN